MKKLVSLMMALALLLAAAQAESFFPAVPTEEYAPSYGAFMGVNPDQESEEDSRLVLAYRNVTQEDFERYGSYLQDKGYSYSQDDCTYDYENCTLIISKLTNGSLSFAIGYVWDRMILMEVYSDGTTPETVNEAAPNAGPTAAPTAKPTAAPTSNVCSYCGGSGECSYCVLGDCDECFGDGYVPCDYCLGGNCRKCDGFGGETKYVFGGDNRWVECTSCRGTGECSRCGGTGEQKCLSCNGSGDCKYCHGTAVCSYCNGK